MIFCTTRVGADANRGADWSRVLSGLHFVPARKVLSRLNFSRHIPLLKAGESLADDLSLTPGWSQHRQGFYYRFLFIFSSSASLASLSGQHRISNCRQKWNLKGAKQQWHLRQRKAKWNFNDNGAIFRQWSGPGSCRDIGAHWDVPTPLPLITSAAQAVTSFTWHQHYLIYKLFLFKQKLLGLMCLMQTLPFLAFQTSGLKSIRVRHHEDSNTGSESADDVQQNLNH